MKKKRMKKNLFWVLFVALLYCVLLVAMKVDEATTDTTLTKQNVTETETETDDPKYNYVDASYKAINFELWGFTKGEKSDNKKEYDYYDGMNKLIVCCEKYTGNTLDGISQDPILDIIKRDGFKIDDCEKYYMDYEGDIALLMNGEKNKIPATMSVFLHNDKLYKLYVISENWALNSDDMCGILDSVEYNDGIDDESYMKKQYGTIYEEDMYKVGKDIPAGEYILFTDEYSAYYSISSDSSGDLDSIISNEKFSNNSIIEVREGEYLDLSRCYAVKSKSSIKINSTGEGMFRVGIDIMPGEYKIVCDDDDRGYYSINANARNNIDSIIANKNFTKSTYVTVNNGQYLKLSRCHIKK